MTRDEAEALMREFPDAGTWSGMRDLVIEAFERGRKATAGPPYLIDDATKAANAALFDLIGKPEWDLPCLAEHMRRFAEAQCAKK